MSATPCEGEAWKNWEKSLLTGGSILGSMFTKVEKQLASMGKGYGLVSRLAESA